MISYEPRGAWTDTPDDVSIPLYSGSSFHTTTAQGATATFQFTGVGVSIFGAKRPNYGSYSLSVDGNATCTGNANAADVTAQQSLCSVAGLSNGLHTAVFTNAGGGTIDVDWIEFQTQIGPTGSTLKSTVVDDSDQLVSYLPSSSDWQVNQQPVYKNGTLHFTQVAGASASLDFIGEAVAIYGTVSPDHADMIVNVDGKSTVVPGGSQGSISGLRTQVLLYFSNSLESGNHSMTISGSSQSAATPFIDLDSISIFNVDATALPSSTISTTSTTSIGIPNSTSPTSKNDSNASGISAPLQSSHHNSKAIIIGAVVGSVIVLVILVFLFVFILRRRRQRLTGKIITPETPALPMQSGNITGSGLTPFSRTENPLFSRSLSPPTAALAPIRDLPFAKHLRAPSFATTHSRVPSTSSLGSNAPLITVVPTIRPPQPRPSRKAPPMADLATITPDAPTRPIRRGPTLDFQE